MQHDRSARNKTKGLRRIPAEWFTLAPKMGLSFWVRVHKQVKASGTRMRDLAAVKNIVRRMKHD